MSSFSLLDAKYEMADSPSGFKDIVLYPHQRTALKAALVIESGGEFYHFDPDDVSTLITTFPHAYILADPVGAGKSFIALGIILTSKIPKNITPYKETYIRGTYYSIPVKIIKSNLIVVDKSVLIQWQKYISTFTNLSLFIISDIRKLREFIKLFNKSQEDIPYDIVLLKCGYTTVKINGDTSILTIVRKLTDKYKWARVFYDDFHILHPFLSCNAISLIYAEFSILISSSASKAFGEFQLLKPTQLHNYEDFNNYVIRSWGQHDSKVPKTEVDKKDLLKLFTISNKKTYIDKFLTMPKYFMYKCVFKNKYDTLIDAIGHIGTTSTDQIAEMLNSDAIESAASELNIKPTTPADVFDKILGDNFTQFMKSMNIIENIEYALKISKVVDSIKVKISYSHIMDKIKNGAADIKKIVKLEITEDVKCKILSELELQKSKKDKSSLVVERLKENFSDRSCQVCLCPLDDMNILIIKCCCIVLCDECAIRGCRINVDGGKLKGKCSNCNKIVDMANDFIFLNAKMKIDDILEKKAIDMSVPFEVEEKKEVTEDEKQIAEDAERDKYPKFWAILDIINNKKIENLTKVNRRVGNILNGLNDVPTVAGVTKKVLIFTNYVETQQKIMEFLQKMSISFMEIKGSASVIYNTISDFKTNDKTVLLFSSIKYCSGMNIEFATDLIFMHNVIDKSIEEQVIGRVHRIGRKYNLNVYHLLYDNENY